MLLPLLTFVACLWSTGETFANSLPTRERVKLTLQLGCSSVEGAWTLWTTTASDSSPVSDVAVNIVLCGTAGSTSPSLLTDEESQSHTAGQHDRSEQKRTTAERPAALTKAFKSSATDQFHVSNLSSA